MTKIAVGSDELEPVEVQYRNVRGVYCVSDFARSNVIIVGTVWRDVVKRADQLLDIVLSPRAPKSGEK
jgi:hypothetical protein